MVFNADAGLYYMIRHLFFAISIFFTTFVDRNYILMRIIDNKKDYYDYLMGVYGIDNMVIYDRRGSTVFTKTEFEKLFIPHSDNQSIYAKEVIVKIGNKAYYFNRKDGDDDWTMPNEMCSFWVWRTKRELIACMENWGYDRKDYAIQAYEDDNVEAYSVIDEDGCVTFSIEIN